MRRRRSAGSRIATPNASRIRAREVPAAAGRGGRASSTRTSAMNEKALRAKHVVAPKSARVSPPIAGPSSRATLIPAAFRLTACESCGRGTSEGISASIAGSPRANPTPITKVSR